MVTSIANIWAKTRRQYSGGSESHAGEMRLRALFFPVKNFIYVCMYIYKILYTYIYVYKFSILFIYINKHI